LRIASAYAQERHIVSKTRAYYHGGVSEETNRSL
jgi:hypothetical protein